MVRNAWLADTAPLDRAEARHRLGIGVRGEPLVGYVGRVGQEKGADVFIESLARLNGSWNAVVIGDGRLTHELQARAEALGIAERMRWAGFVPEAGRFMTALDVFVLSSRTEGTPIALFEAMSARVPVVATRVGGVPDVVSEAEAVLVPPEQPNALAAAIDAVLEDPTAARERTARARERLERDFGPAAWVEAYERVYDEAVSRARAD